MKMETPPLPIEGAKNQILEYIKEHQVLIIGGPTGSGKSTCVPIMLYNNFLLNDQKLVITQPRRVAATSLCKYVAFLLNSPVGDTVGFNIRFHNRTTDRTRIAYVTDGILLREATADPLLRKYSVVIIDEVHERSIRSDILLGVIKLALPKRPNLKVVIMSATLETGVFTSFFENSALINVEGNPHPVEIYYTPLPYEDYIEAALIATFKINLSPDPGDILIFLPGQDDIEILERILKQKVEHLHEAMNSVDRKNANKLEIKLGSNKYNAKNWKQLDVVVLYSALTMERQNLVFRPTPAGARKVVLATNIAETSLTIPGITFVIDTGLVKQRKYNSKNNLESLTLTTTSKASANQRAGRAGREGPGKIYRLYTLNSFEQMPNFTTPEIHLVDFSFVFLELKVGLGNSQMMGVVGVHEFPFIDPPKKNTIVAAAINLYRMGALDADGNLTKIG